MSIGTVLLRPTSEYSSSGSYWTGDYTTIDEAILDTSDYVRWYRFNGTAGIGKKLYGFNTPTLPDGAIITKVALHMVAKLAFGSVAESIAPSIRGAAAVQYQGANSSLTTTQSEYVWVLRTDDNGAAWTAAAVGALKAGFQLSFSQSNSDGNVYQLWLEVEYVTAVANSVTLRPTVSTHSCTLVPSGGNAYEKVDEATLDTSDYVSLPSYPTPCYTRFGFGGATEAQKRARIAYIKIKGVESASASGVSIAVGAGAEDSVALGGYIVTGANRTFEAVFAKNTATGNPFTWNDIAAATCARLLGTVNGPTVTVYQLWLEVYYVPPFTDALFLVPAGVGYIAGNCKVNADAVPITALRFEVDTDPAFGSIDGDTGDLAESHSAGEELTKIASYTPTAEGMLYGRLGFKGSGDDDYTWYTAQATVSFPAIQGVTVTNVAEETTFIVQVNDRYEQPPAASIVIDGRATAMTVSGRANGITTYAATIVLEKGEHYYDIIITNIWKVVERNNVPLVIDYDVDCAETRIYAGTRQIVAHDIQLVDAFLPDVATISFVSDTYESGILAVRACVGRGVRLYAFAPYAITKQNGGWQWQGKDATYDALTAVTTELVVGQPASELLERIALPALCTNPELLQESITEMQWKNVPKIDIIRQILMCNGLTGFIRNGALVAVPINVAGKTPLLYVSKNEPSVGYDEDPRVWDWLRVWYTVEQYPNPADAMTNGAAPLWTGTVSDVRETASGLLSKSGAYRMLKGNGVIDKAVNTKLAFFDRIRLNWCPTTASSLTIKLMQDASNYLSYSIPYAGAKADGFVVTGGATSESVLSYTIVTSGKHIGGITLRTTQPCRLRIILKRADSVVLGDSGWLSTGTDNWAGYAWPEDQYKTWEVASVELQFSGLYVITASYGVTVPECRLIHWTIVGSYETKSGYVSDRKSYEAYVQKAGTFSINGNWTTYNVYQVLGPAPTGGDSVNVYDTYMQNYGYKMENGQLVPTNTIDKALSYQIINGQVVVTGQVTCWSGDPIYAPNGALLGYQGSQVKTSAASIRSAPVVHYIWGTAEYAWGGGSINGWHEVDLSLAQFQRTGNPTNLMTIELNAVGDTYYDTLYLAASNPQSFYVDEKTGEGKHYKEYTTEGFGSEASARLWARGMLQLLSRPRRTYTVERPISTPIALGDVVQCDDDILSVSRLAYDMTRGVVTITCGRNIDDLQELLKSTGRRLEALERNLS